MLPPSALHGIVPPMVTPFEADGVTVSLTGTRCLVEHLVAQHVHGLFVAGTTGEAPALDTEQWARLVGETAAAVNGRVPLLAGVSAPTTSAAVQRARLATELGADALVATVPYYFSPSQRDIVAHYQAIAAASPLPLVLYDIPSITKVGIAQATYLELARLPSVIGFKDSSGDLHAARRTIWALEDAGRPLRALLGTDALTDLAILAGAHGTVPSLGNVAPGLLVAGYQAAVSGRWQESAAIQRQVQQLTAIYTVGRDMMPVAGMLAGTKCALDLLGVPCGPPAAPLRPLDEEERSAVAAILKAADLLT